MSSPDGELTVVRIFRKRVSKTLKIDNISELRASEKIFFNIALDNNVYILSIAILNNVNSPYLYLAVDHHKDNLKRDVEFEVIMKDDRGHLIFQKSDVIKPNVPLTISTKFSVRDLPPGYLMIHYELCYLSWTEEKDSSGKPKKKAMTSFSRLENLSRDLGQLFTQRTNADFVIEVERAQIPVHSQVLSARSEVFAAMVEHDMSEKRNKTIQVKDMSAMAMHYFLTFIYTGKLEEMKDLPRDTLKQLYSAADKYAVIELKEMCSDFLLSSISLDSVASCAELAFTHCDKRMQDAVIDFVTRNTGTLYTRQWQVLQDSVPSVAAEVQNIVCTKGQTRY